MYKRLFASGCKFMGHILPRKGKATENMVFVYQKAHLKSSGQNNNILLDVY